MIKGLRNFDLNDFRAKDDGDDDREKAIAHNTFKEVLVHLVSVRFGN